MPTRSVRFNDHIRPVVMRALHETSTSYSLASPTEDPITVEGNTEAKTVKQSSTGSMKMSFGTQGF